MANTNYETYGYDLILSGIKHEVLNSYYGEYAYESTSYGMFAIYELIAMATGRTKVPDSLEMLSGADFMYLAKALLYDWLPRYTWYDNEWYSLEAVLEVWVSDHEPRPEDTFLWLHMHMLEIKQKSEDMDGSNKPEVHVGSNEPEVHAGSNEPDLGDLLRRAKEACQS